MTVSTDITAAYRLACKMEDDVRALRLHTRAIARIADVVDADDGPAVQQLAKEITDAADKIEAARSELLLHFKSLVFQGRQAGLMTRLPEPIPRLSATIRR